MITSERVAKRLGTILTLDHVLGTTFKNVKVFQFPSTGKSNPRPYLMPKKSFKRPRRSTLHLNICENNKTLLELGANRAHSLIRIFVTSLINRKVPVKIPENSSLQGFCEQNPYMYGELKYLLAIALILRLIQYHGIR